jgi:hypothetical protein
MLTAAFGTRVGDQSRQVGALSGGRRRLPVFERVGLGSLPTSIEPSDLPGAGRRVWQLPSVHPPAGRHPAIEPAAVDRSPTARNRDTAAERAGRRGSSNQRRVPMSAPRQPIRRSSRSVPAGKHARPRRHLYCRVGQSAYRDTSRWALAAAAALVHSSGSESQCRKRRAAHSHGVRGPSELAAPLAEISTDQRRGCHRRVGRLPALHDAPGDCG